MKSPEGFDPSYEPRQGLRHLTSSDADWSGLRILVTGLGVSGFAACDALSERGSIVTVVSADATAVISERARILEILDVDVRLGPEHLLDVPEGTELVVILGGLFVIITLSVIIQVGSFKMTGKRVFRMAPLQHHFELAGWDEITIVIRFWIIAGLFVAFGLGVFYAEWVVGAG